jgi:adenylosuccinate synthase
MPAYAVVGAQWGDEGKGKIVDLLAERAKVVVRFSGGDNAGHTVINRFGKFVLHLIPCGIFYPHTVCIIGNGVALNPAALFEEMDSLSKRGISDFSRLYVSDRTNLIMPYHQLIESLEEKALGAKAIGTTGKGIGPAFTDKVARYGIRAGDLLNPEHFKERLSQVLTLKNKIIVDAYKAPPVSVEAVYEQYMGFARRLSPHIKDTTVIIDEALKRGDAVMLEGAQGTFLDPDFGTYPFVTSSSPMGLVGAGVGPTDVKQVYGVFKAYCTRVGNGPMPSEMKGELGERLRDLAGEFGATTGRPRRCGWFDAVAARHSSRVNGFTGAIVTRLDILDAFEKLKICTAYRLGDRTIDYFPSDISQLERCQPVFEDIEGWATPISDIREYARLPAAARRYIKRIEESCGCPARIISVGPAREQTIFRGKTY